MPRPSRTRGQNGNGNARGGGYIDRQLAPTWPTARVWCWGRPGLRDPRSDRLCGTLRLYTAIGTVCNLAARLCAEAQDGQILIGQRVAVAVEDTITFEEVGALTLKGLTQ